jgi:dipeptidyl aminopeptidase/acylaminoacyl peptidase
LLIVGIGLLFMPALTTAQEDAPQFLYRDENHLVLLNAYTGEAITLPFEVTERDHFTWSPDGQYLLVQLQDLEHYGFCLNLYDVDTLAWVYVEPISCAVQGALFSQDNTHIVYAVNNETNGILWLYSLADGQREELYRTTEGDDLNSAGISEIWWSPHETYLTFVRYEWIMGGTLNTLVVMDFATQDFFILPGTNPYYASYDPMWSADEHWFLLRLKDQYITDGPIALSNDEGDVYLVNAQTGDQYRLTYTPASAEYNLRWTEDGQIAFTVQQEMIFTPEQAMDVEVIPREDIVRPEPIYPDEFFTPIQDVMVSPDAEYGAWVNTDLDQDESYHLEVGYIFTTSYGPILSVPIPLTYRNDNILLGWRPSS